MTRTSCRTMLISLSTSSSAVDFVSFLSKPTTSLSGSSRIGYTCLYICICVYVICLHIYLYVYVYIYLYIIYIYCRTVPSVTGKGRAIRNRRANPFATLTLCAENACSLCLNRECLTRQGTYQFLLLGILARVQPAILSIIN